MDDDSIFFILSCNDQKTERETDNEKTVVPKIKEENVSYMDDSVTLNGFIAYDENKEGKRPAILIVHEWWGVNDYVKNRARQLAGMGYVAMVADMYGNGKTASNPDEAGKLAMPFYQNPQMMKSRFDAALAKIKERAETDSNNIAAIGYCFGGSVVLNTAKMGTDINGVVSFHGILEGVPPPKGLLKARILVCHGKDDSFVPPQQVDAFKKSMDSIGADYTFKEYPGAKHAFTNPQATEWGKKFNLPVAYNGAADAASWNDMKDFFGKIFR